jgi:hypothetical protein
MEATQVQNTLGTEFLTQSRGSDQSSENSNTGKSALDIEFEKDLAKLRQIFQRRQKEMEDDFEDHCETRWVQIDDGMIGYYGFKHLKFCNKHWVNKTLFVVHRPHSKKPMKCHCCGELCAPQFLCIPCSGEINKSKRLLKKTS